MIKKRIKKRGRKLKRDIGKKEDSLSKEKTKKNKKEARGISFLKNLKGGEIILVKTDSSKMPDASIKIIKSLNEKKYSLIVLSTSRPYANLLNSYKENNINTEAIVVIDTFGSSKSKKDKNIISISNSSSLTEISLSISKCISTIKGKKFVLFDSVNTLLMHNDPSVLAKFIHFVLTKMRNNGLGGIILSSNSIANREVIDEIEQLCDRILNV